MSEWEESVWVDITNPEETSFQHFICGRCGGREVALMRHWGWKHRYCPDCGVALLWPKGAEKVVTY